MVDVSDEQFDQIISGAMDSLPPDRIEGLKNVAILYADNPSEEQLQKLRLRGDQLLLGLYEGIPLTRRNSGYNFVLPDVITLFKYPIMRVSHDLPSFAAQVHKTLWHEIAHYYGLNHTEIYARE